MFNLFVILISSLCIQFAAVDYPIDYTQTCSDFYSFYTTVWENIVARGYAVDPDLGILVDRNGSDANGSASFAFYTPAEPFNNTQSSVSVTLRDDTTVSLSCVNWYRWLVNADGSINSGPTVSNISKAGYYLEGVYTWGNHNTIIYNSYYDLPYGNTSTFNWQTEQPIPIGFGSGSLGVGGHSSGGSPIDELNNNGVTWSSIQGNYTSSGHSVQNVTTPANPDPNSNLELILSGFLGGILNNTNDLLGNTSQLGSVLGGVSNNVIQGSSAIFNGISNLNNTIMDFIAYIREPLDQDRISGKLVEVPIYQTINSLVGFSDSFLSAINSIQDPEHLYLTMDFRNANEPFRRLGLYVFDFTFLDNLKSTWQPILLAILYLTLGVNIFYDLPNIVHGISGLSGGDE